jgi:hypothetical protein
MSASRILSKPDHKTFILKQHILIQTSTRRNVLNIINFLSRKSTWLALSPPRPLFHLLSRLRFLVAVPALWTVLIRRHLFRQGLV